MNILRLTALCAVLAGSMGAVTAANAAGEPQFGDSWITAKTKIALFADTRVKGSEINVETKAGVVMVRGKIDNEAGKAAVAEIAMGIEGVKSVKNELAVVPRALREIVEDKDEVILKNVEASLKSVKHSKSIGVKVNGGVVSLNGKTGSMANSAKASWRAWIVPGVKSVKNDITIKS